MSAGAPPDLHANGRERYRLHGDAIRLPATGADQPDAASLAWRDETRFRS